MKLPEDKNERNKMLLAIGLGVLMVLVVVYMLGVKPLLKSKEDTIKRVEELKIKIEKAKKTISLSVLTQNSSGDSLTLLKEMSDKYILKSIYDNYLVVARTVIENSAKEFGIKIDPVRNGDIQVINVGSSPAFKGYSVRVSGKCGLHQLIKFLYRIESNNPYVTVTQLSINTRGKKDINNHDFVMQIQWPIWSNKELKSKLEQQIKDIVSKGKTAK